MTDELSTSRRTVLTAFGAAASSAALGGAVGTVGAQEDDQNETTSEEGPVQIRLGGETNGWIGQEPCHIADVWNPSLRLESGREYELTWENLDGVEHEVIIVDAEGNELEASEHSEEQGEEVTMTFTASDDMVGYICEYHPRSMRGAITFPPEGGQAAEAGADGGHGHGMGHEGECPQGGHGGGHGNESGQGGQGN